ncbi:MULTISPECIES: hypothetical protein [unclassified Streptomyces]|uniref:hypothetical protein n=1 Tax=unclassified Streptomyces TaxID=2593676 RepID=UPI00143E4731|nr:MULTISPECIES: hypothetical protein [unclassified Streptomyces]QIY60372.1 hypothetical protein HEP85_16245 [Streptomyces sp. RPA4-2]
MTTSEPPGEEPRLPRDGDGDLPRYEPPPSVGKLMIWVLLFFVAALAVVLGGVYFT